MELARSRVGLVEQRVLASQELAERHAAACPATAGAGGAGPASSVSSGRTAASFSARRCCHTVRIIIATVNRKIIVAIT